MKKMFKAIATITAILSMANFVACKSDDDNGGGSDGSGTETVNLAGTYWVVEDEEQTDGNATVKFTNESYIYIKDGSNGTLSQIEEWDFTTEESKTYTSSSYIDTAFTYTVTDSGIKITSGTDTATAILSEDGNLITVTLTVDGETVKSVYNKATEAPTEATLVVTVTSSSTEDETTVTTYNFVGLGFSDFPEGSLAGKSSDKNDKATVLTALNAAYSEGGFYLPYVVANNSDGVSLWTIANSSVRCGSGNFKVRFDESTGLSTAFNYNGGAKADLTASDFTAVYTGTSKTVDRYVMIPVTAAGKIAVSYKTVGSSSGSATCQIGLFNKAGSKIDVKTVDTTSNGAGEGTFETDVTADAEEAYLVFSRNGASGGGIDIYSITFTPSAE